MAGVPTAVLLAGIPATNLSLYHRIRFRVGDPTALVVVEREGRRESTLILRDIEMGRARQAARVDHVACPADFTPAEGLSGDRETATAQAAAECLRQAGVKRVVADRSLPLIYAHIAEEAGVEVHCDPEFGVLDRRAKDEQEVEWLRDAQAVTEGAMEMACRLIAAADVDEQGRLLAEGAPLTAERVRSAIDVWLLERGYANPPSIVAGGSIGADCHNIGSGPLYTRQPVIVDIFPVNRETQYNGDCTRTVVHGEISEPLRKMHAAVVAAKEAGIAATRTGVTGEDVHHAIISVVKAHGFSIGLPGSDDPDSYCGMTHGSGHGVGLEVHEPPLLDRAGPPLVKGDALTIEPGLYSRAIGGVRVEDMVIVTDGECLNLNQLQEGLDWS